MQESDLEVVDGYQGLLVVNKRFSLLICTECGSGMKPESVFKHFTEPHPVIVTSSNGVPDKLESRTVNHHMKLGSERKHLEQLKKWLLAKGIKAASGDNRDKWLKHFPEFKKNTPRDIVQGLQIRPGLICACGEANSSSGAFRKHAPKCKKFEARPGYIQSYHPSNYACWFEVTPPTVPDVTVIPGVKLTSAEQLFRQRQAELYSLVPLHGVIKDSFLETEGIDQLLSKFDNALVYSYTNVAARDPVRKRLVSLRKDTLFADVELLGNSHSSVTYPFIDCSL